MNVFAVAILPFLAAVECHVLADYFADPVGCAADVPVSRDYRRAFQEKNLVFPTYERVSKMFENGFPAAPYGDGNEETIGIDCGGDETWARRSLDCLGKLKNEMNLVIDKLVSQTAEKFESAMGEYILESLVFLEVYEKYVSEVLGGRTPGWLEVPFSYLTFEKPQANVHCALRFLFDGGYAKIDEIYRKFAFFADDHGGNVPKSHAELKSLVSALSGAERSENKNERVPGSSTRVHYSVLSPDNIMRYFETLWTVNRNYKATPTTEVVYAYALGFQKCRMRAVEEALITFSKPFCEKTARWSPSALNWSFLKGWKHYDKGFFVNKSLAEHQAFLGVKSISLSTVFDNVEFNEPLDKIMAANELVPFILHNYIANIAVCFIAFAVVANDRLISFVSAEKPKILAENPPESSADLVRKEHDYYRYFGRLITNFNITYQYYCDVMKHDSATIVRLLDFTSKLFSSEENEPENLKTNIIGLKNMLNSWFNWSQTRVNSIDGWKISIKDLVNVVERINFGLLSLIEFINKFKVDI